MATKIPVAFILLCGIISQARHIHPGSSGENVIKLQANTEEPISVLHNYKLTRFVPLNKSSFFKFLDACGEGFIRDANGICREVW